MTGSSSKGSAVNTASQEILKLQIEYPEGPYTLRDYQQNESVGYLLKRAFTLLSGIMDQHLAPFDLTHPQFSILMVLKQRNCTTASSLARESGIDAGATTRMLDRLEAKDMICRERSTEDRRIINILLTDFGKLVVEKMPIIAINILNRHLSHFEADEVVTLKQLLTKLLGQLEQCEVDDAANTGDKI